MKTIHPIVFVVLLLACALADAQAPARVRGTVTAFDGNVM